MSCFEGIFEAFGESAGRGWCTDNGVEIRNLEGPEPFIHWCYSSFGNEQICARVKGKISANLLTQAGHLLAVRHPSLRCSVHYPRDKDLKDSAAVPSTHFEADWVDQKTGKVKPWGPKERRPKVNRPYFQLHPADARNVKVVDYKDDVVRAGLDDKNWQDSDLHCGLPLWQRVFHRESTRLIDTSQPYMWRLILVPGDGDDDNWVIYSGNHVLTDGTSLQRIIADLMTFASQLKDAQFWTDPNSAARAVVSTVIPLPLRGSTVSSFSLNPFEKALVKLVTPIMLKSMFGKYTPFVTPRQSISTSRDFKTVMRFAAGSEAAHKEFMKEAKLRGVSVGSAFATATQYALLRHAAARGATIKGNGGKVDVPVQIDFNMRTRMSPPLTDECIGFAISVGDVTESVGMTEGFWEHAGRVRRGLVKSSKSKERAYLMKGFELAQSPMELFRDLGINVIRNAGVAGNANVSCLPKYPHATVFDDMELLELYGGNRTSHGGSAVTIWLRTVGSRFFFNISGAVPFFHPQDIEEILDSVVALMESGKDLDGVSLGSYLAGREDAVRSI